ncbi:MAG: ATP-binding protein [Bacteroidales bacterium]|nr:ATP-binding protein [Bacteroidales bacterium]
MIIKKLYILFFFLLYHVVLFAQYVDLNRPKTSFFEDKEGKYSIQKILSPEISRKFEPAKTEIPSFAFTKSVIWCKIEPVKNISYDLYLDVRPRILNTIVFYTVYKDGHIDSILSGTMHKIPLGEQGGEFLFRLVPDVSAYYLKIKTNTRLFVNLSLLTKDQIITKRNNFTINGIYAGILLMIFIYNLFLLFSSSDRTYFYYLLHLSATFVNFLYLSGIGNKYIWTNQLWVNHYFITIMSFGFIFSCLFTIKFLDTKHHSKPLHFGMLISISLLVLIGLIDLSGYHLFAVQLLNIIGFLIILFTIFVSVVILRGGNKPAGIFLSAWMFYFVGTSIQVLQGLDIFPTTIISSNGMLIGSVFELTLLSLSIGYKINFLKEQMRLAAINEQKALSEKEQLMKEESKKLESLAESQSKLIVEKNNRLKQQYEDILKQNKKIKKQNEILKQVHQQLETKNKIIEEQHDKLIYHKNNLEHIISERTVELQKAAEKAKDADEIKTAFLRNVSHEIRTPMNAIAGFAALLLNIDPEDHRNANYKEIIFKNTESLLSLIDNIIDLANIQTESLKLKKVKFRLKNMFNALNNVFIKKIKEKNKFFVSLKVSMPENDDLIVFTDYNRLWQVMYHLLDNAVKYTDTGFIDFGYKENDNGQLEIMVKDSGKGISSTDIEAVFDQFRKNNKDISRLYSGTGLGLSLVKGLVKIMNGTITVRSLTREEAKDKNSGTTFILLFEELIVK